MMREPATMKETPAKDRDVSFSQAFYDALADRALAGDSPSRSEAEALLTDPSVDLLPLVHAAYRVRLANCGKDVQVHVINNAQNGLCPEDCGYCSQAKTSEVDIDKYAIKDTQEILDEARRAYEAGAHRYCMVFSGRGPNDKRTETLANLVSEIKATYNLEVCVSAGLLDDDKAKVLADAGLDRLNHNLNTTEAHYGEICTTHTFQDRLDTIAAARNNGIDVCSGMIVGMGETHSDVVEVAFRLRELEASSIPVNFLLPFDGTTITPPDYLTPNYVLRVLSMFRFVNPTAEIRIAAGREVYLGDLQSLCLYPANSLFLDGYLNSKGDAARKTLQMISDAGFTIRSDQDLSDLLHDGALDQSARREQLVELNTVKSTAELRPTRS